MIKVISYVKNIILLLFDKLYPNTIKFISINEYNIKLEKINLI